MPAIEDHTSHIGGDVAASLRVAGALAALALALAGLDRHGTGGAERTDHAADRGPAPQLCLRDAMATPRDRESPGPPGNTAGVFVTCRAPPPPASSTSQTRAGQGLGQGGRGG